MLIKISIKWVQLEYTAGVQFQTIKEKEKILLNEFTGEGVTEFPVKSLVHDMQNDKWTNSKLGDF